MYAVNTKCEYLINPVGIDIKNPRLMWNCEGGIKQSAYRIVASSEGQAVWDSGKVQSDKMYAKYPMPPKSRQRIDWEITLFDENGNEGEKVSSFFEYGLIKAQDWEAKWITGDYNPSPKKRYPVDCFKKIFEATDTVKARLYITSCGLYEAKVNGQKAGNFALAPGYTDYNKRVQYQTYDVTDLIKNGENAITVELADGWYRGSCGAWGLKNQFGKETKLLFQLELVGADGKITKVCTDNSWRWSNDSEIRFADNKDGEVVEAYRTPSYSGYAKVTSHSVTPTSSNNVSVTEHEKISVKEVITTPSGKTVLDFGQNIAGYISFSLNAKKGENIFLRFGEMLDSDGEFTQKNIQCANKSGTKITPLQQIKYACRDGINEYKTKFAVFGFRYVLIETDAKWQPCDFCAIAVYSDMRRTGFFESSNELLNKFFDCTVWSTKGNSLDVPTDCPTRERHGWSGDAQIFCGTASYLFEFAPFAEKYLNDMYDWQKKNGKLPQIAPYGGVDFYMSSLNGSVGWSDAGVIIPYKLWKRYGDRSIIEKYYAGMKKYAAFMIKRIGKKIILSKPLHLKHGERKYAVNYGQSYGEWAEPKDVWPTIWTDMVLPHPEVSTAYTSYVMELMCEIAEELGEKDDASVYRKYAEETKKSYRAIRKKEEFSLDTDRQAMLVRPLYFGLLDEDGEKYAKERLVKALDSYGWRLGTGFLSTPLILDVLTEINPEYAYRLLENEEMPGWLFMPKAGATTVWESWEGTEAQGGIASLNHYSKGAVCEWLFSSMCGINIAGENKFTISPLPGGNFAYAKAEYESVYGKVVSGWEKTDNGYSYFVSVPANTTADIILPSGARTTVTAGEYRF